MMDEHAKGELRFVQHELIQLVEACREALRKLEPLIGPAARDWGAPPTPVADLFDETPLDELELSCRASNAMNNEGIKTVGELEGKEDRELLRIPNFGKTSLRELREAVAAHRRRREAAGA